MKDKRILLCLGGLCCLCALFVFMGFGTNIATAQAQKDAAAAKTEKAQGRADRITLGLTQKKGLELPAVTFFHDKHTDAMSKAQKSCDSCHESSKDSQSINFGFKSVSNSMSYDEAKNFYHAKCVGCHVEAMKLDKTIKAPVLTQCRSCHSTRSEVAVAFKPGKMSEDSHMTHQESPNIPPLKDQDTNCGVCHHTFDAQAKKLVADDGNGANCNSCHTKVDQQLADGSKPMSLKKASHMSCVSCHYNTAKNAAEGSTAKTAPYTCNSCHGQGA
ncbi:cytochrome c3 family protein [Desulfovibrio litoralis]|uniref:Cytochrome c7 n=1 Tax=Desulfovibrio litoralis DSM 11393 TaxID=1121455 RepID=A0A1M7TQJ0_9BACT|nr:cytochrome c3 family protein [Desulfovibrio litoralis]SHN72936.1 Cytochrome c7 [Desulfovibrio litoralis DSM 11393]